MTEKDIHFLWREGLFRRDGLRAEDGRPLAVEFPGIPSADGPDFQRARIVLGGRRIIGDVEIHRAPAAWDAHGHADDPAYANVILHVVLKRGDGGPPEIPTLVLEPTLKRFGVAPGMGLRVLHEAGDAWFHRRVERVRRAREEIGDEEALYRALMRAMGYARNAAAFEVLAARAGTLRGSADEIERRLRDECGRMEPRLWRLRGGRPANHPFVRMRQMSVLLASAQEGIAVRMRKEWAAGSLEAVVSFLEASGIGRQRAEVAAVNAALPFFAVEDGAAAGLFRRIPPVGSNARQRAVERLAGRRAGTLREQMGLMEIYRRHF